MLVNADIKVNSYYHKMKDDPVWLAKYRETNNKWRRDNPKAVAASAIRSKLKSPENHLLKQAKTRAKLKGHEFSLVLEDIKIPQRCPIMDEVLQYVPGEYSDYSPSIDRIDSSKGYTKDNIQIISSIANRMKWNATREQLLTFCQGVMSLEGRSAPC